MKWVPVFLILSCTWFISNAQINPHWIASTESGATAEMLDVVMDPAGNTYTTGYISGDTYLHQIELDITQGFGDVLLSKLDPDGKFLWAKKFSGPLTDRGIQIVLAANGDLILTGYYFQTLQLDGINLTSQGGSKDIFLARLDPAGNVIWAKSMGGDGNDNPSGLTVDHAGNIILTGQFEGIADYGGTSLSSMIDPLTGLPSYDIFLAKFDGNGNGIWAKAAHAVSEDRGLSVAVDPSDDIYLSGQFSDTLDFFGTIINNTIYNAGFVSKLSAAGNVIWFDKLSGSQVVAYDLVVNDQGEAVVTGEFKGAMLIWTASGFQTYTNPYSNKIFIFKTNPQGEIVWCATKGSDSEVSSRTICMDAQKNYYIGGYFRCNFDQLRDSSATAYWQSIGFRDLFAASYTDQGIPNWFKHAGGQTEDQLWGICIKDIDMPVVAGSFGLNLNFCFSDQYNYDIPSNWPEQNYLWETDYNQDGNWTQGVNGDQSTNAFAGLFLNSRSGDYNYYVYPYNYSGSRSDSIPILIENGQDTVDLCLFQGATTNTYTMRYYGPLYDGVWSNGFPYDYGIGDNIDEIVSVQVNRLDQCYSNFDTAQLIYHPNPALPFLTDNLGIHNHTQIYQNIELCAPDTVNLNFSDLCAGCFAILEDNTVLYDTLSVDSTYQYHEDTHIYLYERNEFGCTNSSHLWINIIPQNDSLIPYFNLHDEYDRNDSIMICEDNYVNVYLADSTTNPTGIFMNHFHDVYDIWHEVRFENNVINSSWSNGYGITFKPQQTGWYVLNARLTIGENPMCDLDIYDFPTDSVYVEIKTVPGFQIIGETHMCPDDSLFLTVSLSNQTINWQGLHITWTSMDGDSIAVNQTGEYVASLTFDYGEISCMTSDYIHIMEKTPPIILMSPADGIVCPGDSVHLWLNQSGLTYNWIGPQGNVISTASDVWVKDQGFYAAILEDNESCHLLTTQVEVKKYTTPFIEVTPINAICNAEPVFLTAVYSGDAQIWWDAPINSNGTSQEVYIAGTYHVSVTQCGFTAQDSVTIVDASIDIQLTASDTEICAGEEVVLKANSGFPLYDWGNGLEPTDSLVVDTSGYYLVQSINSYGCMDTAGIQINVIEGSEAPPLTDAMVCQGDDVNFNLSSPYQLGWFAEKTDTMPQSTGATLSFADLQNDTTIYAAYINQLCPLNMTAIEISVLAPIISPVIIGDTSLCLNQSNTFQVVNPQSTLNYRWVYLGDTISYNDQASMIASGQNPDSIQLITYDMCSSMVNYVRFSFNLPQSISLEAYNDSLCPDDQFEASVNGGGNTSINWIIGNNTWNGTNISLNYNQLTDTIIKVIGVSEAGCISDTLTFEIYKDPPSNLYITQNGLACLGGQLILNANVLQSGSISWQQPNGESLNENPLSFGINQPDQFGWYLASFTSLLGCFDSDSIQISIEAGPNFELGETQAFCLEDVKAFSLPFDPNLFDWKWNGQDSLSLQVIPLETGYLSLTAYDVNGCYFNDSVWIEIVNCQKEGPNVITPNGDGINDYLLIKHTELMPGNCLIVINRWGNIMYEQHNYQGEFKGYTNDGTEMNDGVYFYLFYKDCDDQSKPYYQGYFHLLRN